ncbi:hypothetical protein LTR36_001047 [Oleoguttula mirabilis]|uniref:Uncharacterized protein n=1 Tax=Oleoguttula mirabilis TaxID=1507867 RepID=A0AAV9JPM2_9PEZI|nr:hypothetical protein LTR36_001047 [Oleoguttula mirabilis]
MERHRAGSEISALGKRPAASSPSDDLPMLDMDMSTASESDSIDSALDDMEAISAASADDPSDYLLAAAAQPKSLFAQQLVLRDLSSQKNEQDTMQEWLEGNSDPWSVPKMIAGEARNEHMLALKEMLSQCDHAMSPRGESYADDQSMST